MFSRYRGYTSYSEENGKLVPSIEPLEKDVKFQVSEEQIKKSIEEAKKLKPIEPQKSSRPQTPK